MEYVPCLTDSLCTEHAGCCLGEDQASVHKVGGCQEDDEHCGGVSPGRGWAKEQVEGGQVCQAAYHSDHPCSHPSHK